MPTREELITLVHNMHDPICIAKTWAAATAATGGKTVAVDLRKPIPELGPEDYYVKGTCIIDHLNRVFRDKYKVLDGYSMHRGILKQIDRKAYNKLWNEEIKRGERIPYGVLKLPGRTEANANYDRRLNELGLAALPEDKERRRTRAPSKGRHATPATA